MELEKLVPLMDILMILNLLQFTQIEKFLPLGKEEKLLLFAFGIFKPINLRENAFKEEILGCVNVLNFLLMENIFILLMNIKITMFIFLIGNNNN